MPGADGGFATSSAQFAMLGDRMVFTGNDGVAGRELWVSDGTAAGTVMLQDINFGPADSHPYPFMTLGNQVFFRPAMPPRAMSFLSPMARRPARAW